MNKEYFIAGYKYELEKSAVQKKQKSSIMPWLLGGGALAGGGLLADQMMNKGQGLDWLKNKVYQNNSYTKDVTPPGTEQITPIDHAGLQDKYKTLINQYAREGHGGLSADMSQENLPGEGATNLAMLPVGLANAAKKFLPGHVNKTIGPLGNILGTGSDLYSGYHIGNDPGTIDYWSKATGADPSHVAPVTRALGAAATAGVGRFTAPGVGAAVNEGLTIPQHYLEHQARNVADASTTQGNLFDTLKPMQQEWKATGQSDPDQLKAWLDVAHRKSMEQAPDWWSPLAKAKDYLLGKPNYEGGAENIFKDQPALLQRLGDMKQSAGLQ